MSELDVATSDEGRDYLLEVAQQMVDDFAIALDEAIGRINERFHGRDLTADSTVALLTHEDPWTWARHVYYGRNSFWWVEGRTPTPLPYPHGGPVNDGF